MVTGSSQLQSQVLEDLSGAVNYRKWICDLASPWLGDDPIEIGSGTGDIAAELASRGHAVTASEADPVRLRELRERFTESSAVDVRRLEAPVRESAERSAVLAVNVLEHIPDDVQALRSFADLVHDEGRIVLFVPAFEFAMSRFDRLIGHQRRYSRRSLADVIESAGLRIVTIHYVNAVGLIGWLVRMKIFRGVPKQGFALTLFERLVPTLQRLEARVRPPFGQSLFAVAERIPR